MFGLGKKKPTPAASQPTIAEEAGLPDNWVPAEAPVIRPGIDTNGPHQYPSGTLPQLLGLQPDLVDTKYGGGIPSVRLMPVASTAEKNAAVAATIKTIIQNTPPAASTGAGSSGITFTAPREFIVTGSPGSTIGLAWATELPGTVLQGPIKGLVGFDGSFAATGASTTGGTSATVGGTPTITSEWALYASYIQGSSFTPTVPTGWTDILAISGASAPVCYQAVPPGGSIASQTFTGTATFASAICYFGGPVPTFAQKGAASDGGSGTASVTLTGVTAGNALLVIVRSQLDVSPIFYPGVSIALTDTQGLNIFQLAQVSQGGSSTFGAGAQIAVFILPNASAGSETITFNIGPATAVTTMTVIEITPPAAVPGIPRFQPLQPMDLSKVTGILGVTNGGTGNNLKATGGPSQVLQQTQIGHPITVGQLAASDLSNGTTGTGNVVLASAVAQKVATFDNPSLTANLALGTLFSPLGSGMYRLTYYVSVNRAATTSSTLPNLTLTWVDGDSSQTKTKSFTATVPTGNSLTTDFTGDIEFYAHGSSAIQYQTGDTTAYVSSGATSMQYSVRLRLEAL